MFGHDINMAVCGYAPYYAIHIISNQIYVTYMVRSMQHCSGAFAMV